MPMKPVLLSLIVCPILFSTYAQTVLVEEDFRNNSAPGWLISEDAVLTSGGDDPSGDGWLRLTSATDDQRGAAIYNTAFSSANGITVTFDFATYSDFSNNSGPDVGTPGINSADGISFFVLDGSESSPSVGAFGGSLGYAQTSNSGGIAGVTSGVFGVGLDEFGNFSNPTAGRAGGSGFHPNSITLRGDGNGTGTDGGNNYQWINTFGDDGSEILPGDLAIDSAVRPDPSSADARRVRFTVDPVGNGDLDVFVEIAFGAGEPYTLLLQDTVTTGGAQGALPGTLKFGFAASTGEENNFHEIRNLVITEAIVIPEPSTLVLTGILLSSTGGLLWCRRRFR